MTSNTFPFIKGFTLFQLMLFNGTVFSTIWIDLLKELLANKQLIRSDHL
jgi:hypothetical protein